MANYYSKKGTPIFSVLNISMSSQSNDIQPIYFNESTTANNLFANVSLAFLYHSVYFNGNKIDVANTPLKNILRFRFSADLVIPSDDVNEISREVADQQEIILDTTEPLSRGRVLNFNLTLNLSKNPDIVAAFIASPDNYFVFNIGIYTPEVSIPNQVVVPNGFTDGDTLSPLFKRLSETIEEVRIPVIKTKPKTN